MVSEISNLLEKFLVGGYDCGNIKNKISFLDNVGNIQSFEVSTVIAEAPASKVNLKSSKVAKKNEDTDQLHVRVKSESLDSNDRNKSWYVGVYAKDKDGSMQPEVDAEGKTENKFSQENKKIYLIPLLTGIAVAAMRSDKESVIVPFSGGVPIEDFKKRGENYYLDLLMGDHEIEFIDGSYEGKTVKIKIADGSINIEGVHSVLGLQFDIKEGEIIEIEGNDFDVDGSFQLNDLGAGTTDKAVFDDGELNKTQSTNSDIGTNSYIDRMIKEILEVAEFERLRKISKEGKKGPFNTRENFVDKLLKPEIEKMIDRDREIKELSSKEQEKATRYQPKYLVSWGPVKNIDVTEIVNRNTEEYVDSQYADLMETWLETSVDYNVLSGGGVLFGYYYITKLVEEGFILPQIVEESAFITSRSYCIQNFMEQTEKLYSKS